MKIAQRIALGYAVLILALIGVGGIAILNLGQLQGKLVTVVDDRVPKVEQARDIKDNANAIARAVRDLILQNDPDAIQQEKTRILQARQGNVQLLDQLAKSVVTPEGKEALAGINAARDRYNKAVDSVLEAAAQNEDDAATMALYISVRPAQDDYFKGLDAFAELQTRYMREAADEAKQNVSAARLVVIGIAGAAVLLGIAIAVWVTRSVTRPLGGEPDDVRAIADAIANGDLATAVDTRGAAPGSIVVAMATMRDSLRRMVQQVQAASDHIVSGATQIATGNADLSQRTEEQASNLEQTAASMEEVTGQLRDTTRLATQANELARAASSAAATGGERVGEVVTSMDGITEGSRKIAEITNVIDSLAFQTNILALNAAVEAARAGEQGRGFAVVAGEVRSLAQRSAAAAREIKDLIQASVDRVEAGKAQVDRAREAMQHILHEVDRATQLIGDITRAQEQQTNSIEQVNAAVSQLDQMTQQNAALVEESAAASDSLRQQAQRLMELVSAFRLDAAGGSRAAPADAPRLAGGPSPLRLPHGG